MQQTDKHEYPLLYQRPTCHPVQPNQATYHKPPSSKIITSILSFISGRLATKSNQIKQLIRNGRSASLQRTFKKSFTSFSHSTRNKTRDGLIRVRNIRALNGRFNTSITHAYSIVI